MSVADRAPTPREDLASAYGEMLEELQPIVVALENGRREDLPAAHDAVVAVLRFLQSDPAAVRFGLPIPLARLQIALDELLNGAQPKWLVPNRPEPGADVGGAPPMPTADVFRASFAVALDTLQNAGLSPGKAKAWLSAEADKLELRMRAGKGVGNPIGERTIGDWRGEVREARTRKSNPQLVAAYEAVRRPVEKPVGIEAAKRSAAALLISLKSSGM